MKEGSEHGTIHSNLMLVHERGLHKLEIRHYLLTWI